MNAPFDNELLHKFTFALQKFSDVYGGSEMSLDTFTIRRREYQEAATEFIEALKDEIKKETKIQNKLEI